MVRWTVLDTLAFLLLLRLLLPSLLIMFIPSTFKRPVSSWKALNLRKTLLMASSVRLKPLNCSRLPCVYAQETLRSEERFSRNAETDLVCRLLLEKKKEQLTYGLEAAVISGRFHAAAEGHWATVRRPGLADPTFFGGSVEAGLFLTDDTREYKDGLFKGVKVNNPVGSGGMGAWQVNVRYDRLDLTDAGVIGGTQDGYMASLIWTPVDYVRFLLNYGRLSYGDALAIVPGAPDDFSVDVIGARAQIAF